MKKLIYVIDDERMVLDIAVMILRTLDPGWDVKGFMGPADGLAAVRAQAPDLVLCDQCMHDMQGSQVLEEVRNVAPAAVRIIMSGYFDPPSLSQITSAHQYLCKPFEVAKLRELVERTFAAQARLVDPGIRQVVLALRCLPSIPHVYHALLRELENSQGSTEVLAQIIAEDAGVSAKVLQLANSPLFAQGGLVSNPLEAVMRVGTELIKAVVLSQKVFQRYAELQRAGIDLPRIWQHSWEVARLGRQVGLKKGMAVARAEEVFLAGLLHELGKLVLADNFPEQFEAAWESANRGQVPLPTALREHFKAGYVEVTAYLLQLWGMPRATVDAVSNLEDPALEKTGVFSPTAALYVADQLTNRKLPPDSFPVPEWDMAYLQSIGCSTNAAEWAKHD